MFTGENLWKTWENIKRIFLIKVHLFSFFLRTLPFLKVKKKKIKQWRWKKNGWPYVFVYRELYLENNSLTSLPRGFFQEMEHLLLLNLSRYSSLPTPSLLTPSLPFPLLPSLSLPFPPLLSPFLSSLHLPLLPSLPSPSIPSILFSISLFFPFPFLFFSLLFPSFMSFARPSPIPPLPSSPWSKFSYSLRNTLGSDWLKRETFAGLGNEKTVLFISTFAFFCLLEFVFMVNWYFQPFTGNLIMIACTLHFTNKLSNLCFQVMQVILIFANIHATYNCFLDWPNKPLYRRSLMF